MRRVDLLNLSYEFNRSQITSHIGKRIKTKRFGWFEVVDGDFSNLKIRFDDTGNERVMTSSVVFNKKAKDLYAPVKLGVACIGNATKKGNERFYRMWSHMLYRCYSTTHPWYYKYGELGVTVSDRWKVFEYFLEDMQDIGTLKPNGHEGPLELDKDLKQMHLPIGDRIYSKDTCLLVCKDVNQLCMSTAVFFRSEHEDGKVEENDVAITFMKRYPEIKRSGIHQTMNPNYSHTTHKGWTFIKIEPTPEVVWAVVGKLINEMETIF